MHKNKTMKSENGSFGLGFHWTARLPVNSVHVQASCKDHASSEALHNPLLFILGKCLTHGWRAGLKEWCIDDCNTG